MSKKQGFLGVKNFRERLGWTQKKMSDYLGCKTTPVYHHWETGKNDPPFEVVQKLFELGATVEELFGIAYKGQQGEPVNLASLSDADAAALVKRGLAELAGARG